ncbi:hypothetical protein K0M31_003683 [Melipona bicolor]|uniref:Uncharacterized protein n=1 Tax=Melipona bicolor TaxID=60889 RepID=A0AA40FY64_9HYME|nr:hypothetical protein K0M31_003683 [Melipona bicolor]
MLREKRGAKGLETLNAHRSRLVGSGDMLETIRHWAGTVERATASRSGGLPKFRHGYSKSGRWFRAPWESMPYLRSYLAAARAPNAKANPVIVAWPSHAGRFALCAIT